MHRVIGNVLRAAAFMALLSRGSAATVADYAVRVSAVIQKDPLSIRLQWPVDTNATEYTLYRKAPEAADWGAGISLPSSATFHTDSSVVVGKRYEYRISKTAPGYYGEGYLCGGIEAPAVEFRGKVLLLVDSSQAASLASELARLQEDLTGDGWTVTRHDVPRMAVDPANTSPSVWTARSNEVANLKSLILSEYLADPAGLKCVFLFGHVPVPYAGDLYPDTHPNHRGAWPADGFFADVDGLWADSSVTSTGSSYARNRNLPGDGKFDPGSPAQLLPSLVELEIGRVDLSGLPSFPQTETELLRRYLNKDHSFRHKQTVVQRRGLIDDGLKLSTGEPLAVSGWRNFPAFFGAQNTMEGDWLTTLGSQDYLWGYGCGGGTFSSCSGVATTAQLASSDPRVVFTMFFGSYFGDWDSPDNFLRAALATPTYTLTSVWAGRPHWQFHHMALGETIGYSTKANQNNFSYPQGQARFLHVALMGDPTLRMHPVAPPSGLAAETNGAGGVNLHWEASADSVLGYHLYRAPSSRGPFQRVNQELITATNFTDPLLSRCTYMVRALKLETNASGSYYNLSQGVLADFAPTSALPLLVVRARNATKVYGAPVPALEISYEGFVNGDTTNSLEAQATATTTVTNSTPAGVYPIQVSGASSSNYVISHVDGILTVVPAQTEVTMTSSANPSRPGESLAFVCNVTVLPPGEGIPGGTVQFQFNGTNFGATLSLVNGQATLAAADLPSGQHTVSARYLGDLNFATAEGFLSPNQLVNTPPEALPDILERDATNQVVVAKATLLANDRDTDGDPFFLVSVSPSSAQGGVVMHDMETVSYTPPANVTNVDTFTYEISDMWSATATGLVTVISAGYLGLPAELSISNHQGNVIVRGTAIPGQVVRLQAVHQLELTNWSVVGSSTSSPSGVFQFIDTLSTTQRWYRSIYP